MGGQISVDLGSYVFAYNDSGIDKNFGDKLYGDKLKPSYIPGSYPSANETFREDQQFECRGKCPYKTTSLWLRIS